MWLLTLIESLATGTACGDVYLLRYVFYLLRDVVLTAQRRRLGQSFAKTALVNPLQWDKSSGICERKKKKTIYTRASTTP